MVQLSNLAALRDLNGTVLGVSDPMLITQEMITAFAKATFDEQWIHTDPEKAKEYSPYGTTVAHGYFTISLIPKFISMIYAVTSVKMVVNYGTNKVRFISPLLVNSKLTMQLALLSTDEIKGGLKVTARCTFLSDQQEKPVCIADTISLLYE